MYDLVYLSDVQSASVVLDYGSGLIIGSVLHYHDGMSRTKAVSVLSCDCYAS